MEREGNCQGMSVLQLLFFAFSTSWRLTQEKAPGDQEGTHMKHTLTCPEINPHPVDRAVPIPADAVQHPQGQIYSCAMTILCFLPAIK